MEGTLPFDASEAGSIRKAGSFKGSFKRVVSVEKAGSIVSRDTLGRTHSVKVYREKGTDDRDFDSDDSYGRHAKRAASVTKHTQLATVDEAAEGDADGGAGDGGGDDGSVSFEGGEGIGGGRIGGVFGGTRAPSVAGTAMSEDRTVLTGAPTEEFTTDESESGSDSGSESGSDATSGSGSGSGSDAERGDGSSFTEDEEDSEAGMDDDEPRFDDGSGTTPEWMVGRSMVTSGNLEDYVRPLPFITVPIYRAKGFKDSTSDRVEGGKLKFAIRVLPLLETDVEPELLEKEEEKPLIETKRGKEKRELKEAMVKDSAFVADEEGATMPRNSFSRCNASSAGDHPRFFRRRSRCEPSWFEGRIFGRWIPRDCATRTFGWSCRARGNASAAATITSRRRSRRGSTRCSSLTPSFPGVRSCNSSSWTGTRAGATT